MNVLVKFRQALTLAAAVVATACAFAAQAQPRDAWPSKPIRFVVPFAAGGSIDVVARLMGRHLEGRLGQNVVVENRPGAGGTVGADLVARVARAKARLAEDLCMESSLRYAAKAGRAVQTLGHDDPSRRRRVGVLAYRGGDERDRSQLQELVIRERCESGRLHDGRDYDRDHLELSTHKILRGRL